MSISTIINNPSVDDIECFDTDQLISHLQGKNLNLQPEIYSILQEQKVNGHSFLRLTVEELRELNIEVGSRVLLVYLINELNDQKGLLTIDEVLSCILPPLKYNSKVVTGRSSIKVFANLPDLCLWDNFFEDVNQFNFDNQSMFQRPQFLRTEVVDEDDVREAISNNICKTLNRILEDYKFSRLPTPTPGIPDFTCHYAIRKLILTIEVKRKHVIGNLGNKTYIQHCESDKIARKVLKQIYYYMVTNELKYSVLSTYEQHWFLFRPTQDELLISKTLSSLSISSQDPPVLRAYAYIALLARSNHLTPYPNILQVPAMSALSGGNTCVLRSMTNSFNNNLTSNKQSSSSTSARNHPEQQNLDFEDFKFKNILSHGRSGKTLLCEFRGEAIALKSSDLSKAEPHILKELQKEVEIYKILADIQGEYIPKLVCYGYYGGGMCYVIGTTLAGTALSDCKNLTDQQRIRVLQALKAIHDRGVLHNDIREENILLKDNRSDVYLIDFGMSSHLDARKKRKLFKKEEYELSRLLDQYII